MAPTVINTPSTGGLLGEAFGTGLKALAQHKLDSMAQRQRQTQTQKFLETALPGRKAEEYAALAGGDPKLLQQFIKGELDRPGEEAYANAINQLMGGEQGVNLPDNARLNSQQATNLANLSVQKEKRIQEHQEKKQKGIDSTNKSWNENLDKQLGVNQKILDIALERKRLLDSGKVYTGWWGKLPKEMQNDETQEYSALGDSLSPLLASTTGQATNLKTKLAGSSKGDVSNTPQAQKNINDYTIKKAKDFLNKGTIRANLIAKNNGLQPENLSSLVEENWKNNTGTELSSLDEVIQELSQNNAPIGTEIEDDEGNILYWNGQELVEERP